MDGFLDPNFEWSTTEDAAAVLGGSTRQVRYPVAEDRLPAVRRGGRWYFRRRQVEVIAHARGVRWHQGSIAG